MEKIKLNLEKLALRVVTLEAGDIPAMGEILNSLASLSQEAPSLNNDQFLCILLGLKEYTERLILDQESDVKPVEDGITTLQEIYRAVEKGEDYRQDAEALLNRLGVSILPPPAKTDAELKNAESQIFSTPDSLENDIAAEKEASRQRANLNEEDIQILGDFVLESMENLESIEINLVDLEQDPTNSETINAIFRPFHTVKGVSGFLNLKKINRLSHCTENLLDSARQGEYKINDAIVDVILESVDFLKRLVNQVEASVAEGSSDLEGGIDVEGIIVKVNDAHKVAVSENIPLGERLIQKGVVKEEAVETSLEKQKTEPQKKIGKILIEEKSVASKEVISALRDQKKAGIIEHQVKVDTHKLDNLIDLTGELVISQSMLRQNTSIQGLADQQLHQNFSQLNQIVSSLQKITMSMRMVPIKNTFQKMVRLVRDLARNSGKQVNLEMTGEETEIDRNVVEELYEPMVHMIRNSVDHGLETPAERRAMGKNEKGLVHLRAYHKGGNIIIEIEDDGRGLNKERIIEKAISTGLIESEAGMSDSEIFELIFHPGFSTAQQITDVSGRGVGMDVVKKGIEKLRGRLDVQSTQGQGTTVIISLPLTLAIIEGMLVRVGKERYILPTMAILESFKPKKKDYYTVKGKGEMVMARGKLIPLIRIDSLFGIEGDAKDPWDGLVVVVENKEEQRGLLLDELLGQEEIVIKSLGEALKHTKGLAGGAILGDGRVGLILDMAGLFEISEKQPWNELVKKAKVSTAD
ncbi:MAG: chemotaxis protein CheA [Desulfobacterales bacterium]|jgi:two-component system chemotaxis sensor kinase CheA|nr:chemotaxis protein CheA [Desulfobacterales bacterium]